MFISCVFHQELFTSFIGKRQISLYVFMKSNIGPHEDDFLVSGN